MKKNLGVWFPTVRTNTGTDQYTERLVEALNNQGIRSEITWFPHHAEYAPWLVRPPKAPSWANIAHINSWLPSRLIPSDIAIVTTLHSCVHDHALTPYKGIWQRLYHWLWIRHCEKVNLRRSKVVTAVSHYTASQARQIFGLEDIKPIHNWIDLDRFSPDNRPQQNHPFRLVYVGNASQRKGTDLLPRIMKKLGADYELRFTGNETDFASIDSLPNNMIPLGRVKGDDSLCELYRAADALLFPTRLEGLSLVALEAQACGLPVITTKSSSMPEIVKDGVTGFLCPLDDIDAMTDCVKTLKQNFDIWQAMRISARKRTVELFSEENALERYIEVYLQCEQDE
jgi:glycosyltransferase involved in cell wall biosynthesis